MQRRSLDKLILDLNPGSLSRRAGAPGVSETYGRREHLPSLAAMDHSGIAVK